MGAHKVIVWGASGHALVVADALRQSAEWDLVGFLDDFAPEKQGKPFGGARVLGGREQLDLLRARGIGSLIVGVGDCQARLELAAIARGKGFRLATAVHPSAVVAAGVPVGEGTLIAAGAVVNPGAVIGRNVILNTRSSVDHECEIADGVHIGPGALLGGRIVVEEGAWIGIGVVVSDRVRIGARSIIGAGAVVLEDIPPEVIAYGVPAKAVRKREPSVR